MSRLSTRKLLAAGLMLVAAPWASAQDPVPIGFTQYKYQPAWGVPQMPAFIAQPPMPHPYPQPAVQQMSAYHGQHQLPPAPPPPSAAPPVAHGTSGCNSCACRKLPVFDGSHLASVKAWLASHHPHKHHPHGPLAIDSLPTHPYARSPRDFFMFYENLEAERSRDLRPSLIP